MIFRSFQKLETQTLWIPKRVILEVSRDDFLPPLNLEFLLTHFHSLTFSRSCRPYTAQRWQYSEYVLSDQLQSWCISDSSLIPEPPSFYLTYPPSSLNSPFVRSNLPDTHSASSLVNLFGLLGSLSYQKHHCNFSFVLSTILQLFSLSLHPQISMISSESMTRNASTKCNLLYPDLRGRDKKTREMPLAWSVGDTSWKPSKAARNENERRWEHLRREIYKKREKKREESTEDRGESRRVKLESDKNKSKIQRETIDDANKEKDSL